MDNCTEQSAVYLKLQYSGVSNFSSNLLIQMDKPFNANRPNFCSCFMWFTVAHCASLYYVLITKKTERYKKKTTNKLLPNESTA